MEKLEGGIIAQIRKLAPLIVPVTINAIVGGEDIIDAMDLRCFGIGKRADWVLIAFSIALFLGSTAASISGFGRLWVPQWILNLATMR